MRTFYLVLVQTAPRDEIVENLPTSLICNSPMQATSKWFEALLASAEGTIS